MRGQRARRRQRVTGRPPLRRLRGRPAMRPGSLPANGRVAAVPGGAQGGFSRASEGLALDPLLILSRWSGRPPPDGIAMCQDGTERIVVDASEGGGIHMEEVSVIGIDLAKRSFQVHGAKADGSVVFRRKLSRGKVLSCLASQPPCTVAMEACAGAHYWGREIAALGHEVRLVPADLREAVRQAEQERRGGRGGDHGSGRETDHALRGGQDGGAAGAGDALSHA